MMPCVALRVDGFSKSDEVLMTKKIQCLRDVPAHGNIVRFIGEVDEDSPEGPTDIFSFLI